MILGREKLCALIPHAGAMCLLDGVENWSDDHIVCISDSHHLQDNPLRSAAGLAALHGVEYGAQAMAVHGGLLAQQDGRKLSAGYLAALRDVSLHSSCLDELPGALHVTARRLLADGGNLMYHIEVSNSRRTLVEARITVIDMSERL
ncbi:MAG: hypothetical protein WCX90_08760 [Thiohalomonadaceae bacterium]